MTSTSSDPRLRLFLGILRASYNLTQSYLQCNGKAAVEPHVTHGKVGLCLVGGTALT